MGTLASVTLALFLMDGVSITAQEEEAEDEQSEDTGNEGETDGYHTGGRQVGGPSDIETDLNTSFPKPDSVFTGRVPEEYFRWKERLYEKHGVKLAFSYQTLYQWASETRGDDTAWGHWLQIEGKWDAVNRGQDYQGSLVFDLDWRDTIGDNANPVLFGPANVGSLWPTDIAFFEWDLSLAAIYWDQWLEMGVFNLRTGKQLAANTYDFFRFKDARTSFSATPFTAHTSIPAPGFGYGAAFKWWPVRESTFYVHGTVNDMNGDPEEYGLDTLFDESQFFYGLEVGYFWKRSLRDFDHVHLDVFYADERDSTPVGLPNEPGGSFKLLGSKQWEDLVGFGSYTYNQAEGGGFGLTFGEHTVTAGVSRLQPFDIRGEMSLGAVWMDPINDALDDQFGGEAYWKILLTPDLWVTPGVQMIWDPALNPQEDFVTILQLKMRLFL